MPSLKKMETLTLYADDCFKLVKGDAEIPRDIHQMTQGWTEQELRSGVTHLCQMLKGEGKKRR